MRNFFTLALSMLFAITARPQSGGDILRSNQLIIPERTPTLEALYEEAEDLYENGTAEQINANRLAIKNEWTLINPEIGTLYTPINVSTDSQISLRPKPYLPTQMDEYPDPSPMNRNWGDDILIRNDFVDGVDIEVTRNTGDIYVGMYENNAGGGINSIVLIYRSQDNGASWELFGAQENGGPDIVKMQLISIDGTGRNFILAYILLDNGVFGVFQWDISNGDFDFQTIQSGVLDFSVDRSFQDATASIVVLASYIVDAGPCNSEVMSARSTAGSYGFDWVDEVPVFSCGEQIDYTYARTGDAFIVYTRAGSGNLNVQSNTDLNDPASWSGFETIVSGAVRETVNPIIRAARRPIGDETVIVWTSDRATGSGSNYDGVGYKRENGGSFTLFETVLSDDANRNIAHTDGWVRKQVDNDVMRMSYVNDNIDNSANDEGLSLSFNGGVSFDSFEQVSDGSLNIFDGFPSAIAETADNEPCLVFAGTSGGRGFGLYFDTRADLLAIEDHKIEGLSYYPNPTNDSMTISAENEILSITIYTMLGQSLLELKPNAKKVVLQTSTLTSGIFFINVTAGRQMERFKIMKN